MTGSCPQAWYSNPRYLPRYLDVVERKNSLKSWRVELTCPPKATHLIADIPMTLPKDRNGSKG
jgi:hypothetical protein